VFYMRMKICFVIAFETTSEILDYVTNRQAVQPCTWWGTSFVSEATLVCKLFCVSSCHVLLHGIRPVGIVGHIMHCNLLLVALHT
jgi:hypothetical protein